MIRLQKLLAGAGLGSRRLVEDWIRAGRITVNGRTATLGDRAGPGDRVCLDGRALELAEPGAPAREVLLYYKPLGEVTTRSDPEHRPTVFERLPAPAAGRWINVGRLDVNTSGILLLTTDGELAHRLMHPSSEVPREYLVRLRGRPGPEVLARVLKGVTLEDGPARFDAVSPAEGEGDGPDLSHSTYKVVLHEGRNREVRRLWSAAGFEVSRLLRIRYGPIGLPRDLKPGQSRLLGPDRVAELAAAAGQKVTGPGGAGEGPSGRAEASPRAPGRGPRRPGPSK
ncbi:MAG: rRNA pseudouridine synthase [Proteobacteria bacterium]|nr:rRNA pseudouridine synthase [Pseudomonadota bacterium]